MASVVVLIRTAYYYLHPHVHVYWIFALCTSKSVLSKTKFNVEDLKFSLAGKLALSVCMPMSLMPVTIVMTAINNLKVIFFDCYCPAAAFV